jgi:hypothetical protein
MSATLPTEAQYQQAMRSAVTPTSRTASNLDNAIGNWSGQLKSTVSQIAGPNPLTGVYTPASVPQTGLNTNSSKASSFPEVRFSINLTSKSRSIVTGDVAFVRREEAAKVLEKRRRQPSYTRLIGSHYSVTSMSGSPTFAGYSLQEVNYEAGKMQLEIAQKERESLVAGTLPRAMTNIVNVRKVAEEFDCIGIVATSADALGGASDAPQMSANTVKKQTSGVILGGIARRGWGYVRNYWCRNATEGQRLQLVFMPVEVSASTTYCGYLDPKTQGGGGGVAWEKTLDMGTTDNFKCSLYQWIPILTSGVHFPTADARFPVKVAYNWHQAGGKTIVDTVEVEVRAHASIHLGSMRNSCVTQMRPVSALKASHDYAHLRTSDNSNTGNLQIFADVHPTEYRI